MAEKSCWTCSWNRLGGGTFMGVCWWFVKTRGYAREVPKDICDKGCKSWTDADIDFKPLEKFLKSAKKIMEDKQNGNRTNP